jgi:hypothetical protein
MTASKALQVNGSQYWSAYMIPAVRCCQAVEGELNANGMWNEITDDQRIQRAHYLGCSQLQFVVGTTDDTIFTIHA